MEDIVLIIKELLKYDDLLINSDQEEDKEYLFDAGTAFRKLKDFVNKQ